jgi:hypothetical protein
LFCLELLASSRLTGAVHLVDFYLRPKASKNI